MEIETSPTGTNAADIILVLITNPNNPYPKRTIIFGGEATVKIALPEGQEPGSGERNTYLALIAAEKMDQHSSPNSRLDRKAIRNC